MVEHVSTELVYSSFSQLWVIRQDIVDIEPVGKLQLEANSDWIVPLPLWQTEDKSDCEFVQDLDWNPVESAG